MMDFPNYPYSEPLIFDSHAHYDDAKFDEFRTVLLAELPARGVCGVINCGCDAASSEKAVRLTEKYPYFYAAAGIHPENIGGGTTAEIERLAEHKKCVAIGEIGLDYYWVSDNKEQQKALFEEQLILANKLDLPVIVHDRDAHSDTLELLKKHCPKGVVHSFSGSAEMAEEILKTGMYIGVGGVITFKNARKSLEVVREIPLERLVLETDCPYLAPEPNRGKRNDSSLIPFIAERIGETLGMNAQEILTITKNNARNLYSL